MDHPFRLSAIHNLNLLARFHNDMSQLLHDAKDIIWEELEPREAQRRVHLYETDFSKKLRNSVFLMVFGHLEEMLLQLLSQITPEIYARQSNSNLLTRCKPMFMKVLGENPDRECPSLKYIKDASRVRNALIHSSGNVHLMRNPETIEGIVRANSADYEIYIQRVSVTRQGLKNMIIHTRTLVEDVGRNLELP